MNLLFFVFIASLAYGLLGSNPKFNKQLPPNERTSKDSRFYSDKNI